MRDRLVVEGVGEVSYRVTGIEGGGARFGLALAHGAGAGMDHPFMEQIAEALAGEGVAALRYQFPYLERGSRRPDRAPVLMRTVRAAVAESASRFEGLVCFAGGKSMGGRMSSRAAAGGEGGGEGGGLDVSGLVFYGFPLHPSGKPGVERAAHLSNVQHPMLFLQGERDRLADLDLLRPVCEELGDLARLEVVPDADHGFHVPKRSGKADAEVIASLARLTREWMEHVC